MSPTRRFALLILIIILAGAGAAPAQAGEYTVQSCNAALGYRGTGWAAASSHPHLAVYDNCLPGAGTPAWNAGLVTRNGVASDPKATVPQGAYSAWTFRAPTGAKLSRIGYHHEFCGWSGFKAGIASASGTWLHASGPAACGTMAAPDFTLALGGATSVQLRTQCVAGPCKVGDGLNAYGTISNVAVTISDTTKPSLAITGGPPRHRDGSAARSTSRTAPWTTSGSSMRDVRGTAVARRPTARSATSRSPCHARIGLDLHFDTRVLTSGRTVVRSSRRPTPRATAVTQSSRINVDNEAARPADESRRRRVATSWRQQQLIRVAWRNPSQDRQRADRRGARTPFAPRPLRRATGRGCTFGTRQSANHDDPCADGACEPASGTRGSGS